MESLRDIRRRIAHTGELGDIIGAVRALAAVRLRRANDGIDAIRAYAAIVAGGLREAVSALPGAAPAARRPPPPTSLTIAFGSQHGFVGGFNDIVLAAADARGGELWIVGERARALAAESGLAIAGAVPMATRADSVDDLARALARRLLEAAPKGAVDLVYVPYHPGHPAAVRRRLLPFDVSRFGGAPPRAAVLRNLPPEELAARFADEHLLAELAQVAMESFASENRARLHSMDQTHDSIERRLADLRREAHLVRQAEITTELIDILTGAEAQRARSDRSGYPAVA